MAGSCQTLDSIGSSVKLTNIEISTAATMVMPNSWKNLPMMPPMKPIGRNTATIDSVVASTARPISLRAVQRRVVRGLAHLHVAHDVLAHDDGVVDQQAHAQATAPSA